MSYKLILDSLFIWYNIECIGGTVAQWRKMGSDGLAINRSWVQIEILLGAKVA